MMSGWKTWVGGLGMIATGIGTVIGGILAEPLDWAAVEKGIALIAGGIAVLGIGHKIEKSGQG